MAANNAIMSGPTHEKGEQKLVAGCCGSGSWLRQLLLASLLGGGPSLLHG
jgi:hypothetical protein